MFQQRWITLASVLFVAACQPANTPKATAVEPPVTPRAEMAEAFPTCAWTKVSGAGLSLYSYTCGPDRANMQLVVDEDLPGFAVESTDPQGRATRELAIMLMFRNPDEPLEAIATTISSVSPALEGDSCALLPAGALNPRPDDRRARYIWGPTDEAKARWEAAHSDGQSMPPPCGPLGVQHNRITTFEVLKEDPAKVVAVVWRDDVQPFDPSTIRSTEPVTH